LELAGIVCCAHSSIPSGLLSPFVCQIPDGNVAPSDSALLSITLYSPSLKCVSHSLSKLLVVCLYLVASWFDDDS
jgi:hypothetical protein